MSTIATIFVLLVVVLTLLVIGNLVFSIIAERKNPPVGKFIECDGVRMHYREWGDATAPCVVLFHGNGTMIQDFSISGVVDLLARRNRVVCFDRPGFGHSQRPRSRMWTPSAQAALFVKALKRIGARDPVVVGHSWGTLVAVALSLREDYSVRSLVLASGYYFPTWRLDVWLLSGPAVPILGDLFRYTVAPIISLAILPALLRKIFRPHPVPEAFKREFPISLALRPKQLRAAAEESAFLIPAAAQLESQYPRIKCPVQLFHGNEDHFIEYEQSCQLHRALPRSALRFVPNAGHMVHYTDPLIISQAVETLARVQTRFSHRKQDGALQTGVRIGSRFVTYATLHSLQDWLSEWARQYQPPLGRIGPLTVYSTTGLSATKCSLQSRIQQMPHVPWYRRKDYKHIRSIMDDADQFPETFDEWEKTAKRRLASAAAAGVSIQSVMLDPGEFLAYCKANNLSARGDHERNMFARASALNLKKAETRG